MINGTNWVDRLYKDVVASLPERAGAEPGSFSPDVVPDFLKTPLTLTTG
jgi:hypothetical protein